jgi:hypothetical protein
LAEAGAELVAFEQLPGWNVARALIRRADGHPQPLFVKWPRTNVEPDIALQYIRTEHAALRFLNELDPSLAPHVTDAGPSELVLTEILEHGRSLWELLRDNDAEAVGAYRDFASCMARLHSATARNLDRWDRARRDVGLPPTAGMAENTDVVPWQWDLHAFDAIGVPASSAAQTDFHRVREALTQPGPFLALSNGDPGANNFIATHDGGRLIDFEYARFRHALIDAACLHVQHSVWMTIAKPSRFGVVEIYRDRLAQQIPEAEDDTLFHTGIAGAAAVRVTERLRRFGKLDARPFGHESRQQMIATLEAAVATLAEYGVLIDLEGWLLAVASALRRRWPDADVAFRDAFTVR